MSPSFRRAMHQALDIVLDALEAEQEQRPQKRKRGPAVPSLPKIELTPEERERARKSWEKSGWRKAG